MSAERSLPFQRHLGPLLKSAGFTKKAATWWKSYPDSVAVLNIQGSQWGPTLYVNLGICFRFLASKERPPIDACHLLTRLESLVPDPGVIVRALDFSGAYGGNLADSDRLGAVEDAIRTCAFPWFDAFATVQGARAEIRRNPPRALQVAPPLRSTIPHPKLA